MATTRRLLALTTLLTLTAVRPTPSTCAAQDTSFRMPVYSDEDTPPPPPSRADVEKLLAGADASATPDDKESKPLRLVLVAGPKDHDKGEHDYPNWQKVWSRLLAKAPNTTIDTAWEFPSQEQIDNADVLVFYQRGRWDDARAAAIDPFLARGGGCVYIHWAVDGQGGQDEFAKRIGLASLGGGIKFRHGGLDVDFAPGADHPIARNFDKVHWVDESYWELFGDPSQLDLIGTGEEDGKPQPLFWTVERGRGRVFVSIPGHYMWTFDDPAFRLLLLRGIAWAGHRNVDRFNDLITLDARMAAVISVGQAWAEATAAARHAGYELHDASQLAMAPTPDGFYVNLPGDRGLIVLRNQPKSTVERMSCVDNWGRPKSLRKYQDVYSFELPDGELAQTSELPAEENIATQNPFE